MKKKIFSISMVKNEDDVIESFVRYNLHVFDGMIILDNGSTDDTVKILKMLKSEGLPVFLFEDNDREFDQVNKMNKLLLKAVDEFKSDIVVPLDADEFLISSKKGNPRKFLEKIDSDTYYEVKWRTYVPDFGKNNVKKFVPSKITLSRDDSLEEFFKVIIPKELVKNYAVKLTKGNHGLVYDSNCEKIIRHVDNDMRIAHFPIRSKEQLILKITVKWIYNLSRPERIEGNSFHQQKIFNELKEKETITNEDVVNFAKNFALKGEEKIILNENAMDLTFCKDVEMKYTPEIIKPFSHILESCEWLARAYSGFQKDSIVKEKRLEHKIEDLALERDRIYNLKMVEEENLKNKIEKYEKSTSWIITAPLRKFGNLIRTLK